MAVHDIRLIFLLSILDIYFPKFSFQVGYLNTHQINDVGTYKNFLQAVAEKRFNLEKLFLVFMNVGFFIIYLNKEQI